MLNIVTRRLFFFAFPNLRSPRFRLFPTGPLNHLSDLKTLPEYLRLTLTRNKITPIRPGGAASEKRLEGLIYSGWSQQ